MSTCTACAHPAGDGAYACTRCTHRIRGWLAEIPRQLPLLQAELAPGSSPRSGRLYGGRGPTLPLRLDVLTLTGPGNPAPATDPHGDATGPIPLTALLAGWAGYIAAQHPAVTRTAGTVYVVPCETAAPRAGATVTGWCHWLTAYLPFASTHPWIAELHHQLQDTIGVIRSITRATPQRHPRAAPCPACEAFALAQIDGEWGISCQACGEHLDPDAYDQHAADVLATVQSEDGHHSVTPPTTHTHTAA